MTPGKLLPVLETACPTLEGTAVACVLGDIEDFFLIIEEFTICLIKILHCKFYQTAITTKGMIGEKMTSQKYTKNGDNFRPELPKS